MDAGSRNRIRPELKFSRFVREAFNDLTNIDSRFWLTVRGLARPGHLTREWVEGRGDRALPPMRLYLIASAAFFLLGGSSWLMSQSSDVIALWVTDERVSDLNVQALRDAVLHRINSWVALIRMCSLLVLGLLLAALAPRNGPRLVPSLVLAMHFYTVTFFLIAIMSLALWLAGLFVAQQDALAVGYWLVYAERAVMGLWLIIALRRVHERSWWMTVSCAVLVWLVDSMLLIGAFAVTIGVLEVFMMN